MENFNDIMSSHEKEEGRHVQINKRYLKYLLVNYGGVDLVAIGPRFTWTNKHIIE